MLGIFIVSRGVKNSSGMLRTERSSGGKVRWLGPCRPEFEPPWLRISGLSLGFAPNNIMLPLAWSHKENVTRPVAYGSMVGSGDLIKDAI